MGRRRGRGLFLRALGTYRQWHAAGAQVRKGEQATPIIFWKAFNGAASCTDHNEVEPGSSPSRLVGRVYFVFNQAQVDGAEPPPPRLEVDDPSHNAVAQFIAATGMQIRHGGDQACYIPSIDQIWLPQAAQFRDSPSYYAVLGHEAIHWTGAQHRLDRQFGERFGNAAYAFEELIAELGAAFLAALLGLSLEPRPDHAVYIASWLKALRDDPRAILTAAAKAQQAVDYLERFSTDPAAQPEPYPARASVSSRIPLCLAQSPS